jgi:hypothetical protein
VISIDVAEFRMAYLELKFAGEGLDKDMREGVKAAGQGAVDAVRREAAWSSRIPAATRLKISFGARSAGVTVVTDARRAPEARPLNHGEKPGTFRHPVYGHRDRWVAQPARPFFQAAGEAPEISEQIRAVLDHVAFHAGFK